MLIKQAGKPIFVKEVVKWSDLAPAMMIQLVRRVHHALPLGEKLGRQSNMSKPALTSAFCKTLQYVVINT